MGKTKEMMEDLANFEKHRYSHLKDLSDQEFYEKYMDRQSLINYYGESMLWCINELQTEIKKINCADCECKECGICNFNDSLTVAENLLTIFKESDDMIPDNLEKDYLSDLLINKQDKNDLS